MMSERKLRAITGKRARKYDRKPPEEATVRIVFVPSEGSISCHDAETHFAYQIQAPIVVTVPKSAVGYLRPEQP